MKKIFKSFVAAACVTLMGLTAACSADKFDGVDPNGRPNAGDIDATIVVDQETNTYTLTLNNKGYYPVWTVNVGKNPKVSTVNGYSGVIAEAGTYPVEVRMGNKNGLSEGSKVYEIVIENSLAGDVFKGFNYDSDFNLWKNANVTFGSTWFANNDWVEITAPQVSVSNESISLTTPTDMGGSQWQGQVHILTDIEVSATETYDFSVFVNAPVASNVTVKLHKEGDDDTFIVADIQSFKANGSTYFFSDLPGFDGKLKLALDFGGNPGVDFELSNIVFKNHKNDDGTELPPAVEFDPARNIFAGYSVIHSTTWFADAGWSDAAITQPTINFGSDGYDFVMPSGVGGDQWQGQVHMWTNVHTQAGKSYDFCVTILSSEDHPGVTIKLQKGDSLGNDGDTDDNVFFALDRKPVKANIPYTYYFENKEGFDTDNLQLCMDYAGGAAGSTIEISNIMLQEHL